MFGANPPEGRLIPASTSFGRLAGIDALTGGFESFDWRVLDRVLAGFETMTWEDENALGGSGFRPRDLLRATSRLSCRFRYADSATSVDRPRHFARPTLPTRSTDFAAARGRQLELPRSIFVVAKSSNDKEGLV